MVNTEIAPPLTFPGWKPSKTRKLTSEPIRFANGMRWEMDGSGFHRIVDAEDRGGDWVPYQSIAISPCGEYVALSAYYDGGLPCETVMKIMPTERN